METRAALRRAGRTLAVGVPARVVPMLGDYELPYLCFTRDVTSAGLIALDRGLAAGKLPREARKAGARWLQTLARV